MTARSAPALILAATAALAATAFATTEPSEAPDPAEAPAETTPVPEHLIDPTPSANPEAPGMTDEDGPQIEPLLTPETDGDETPLLTPIVADPPAPLTEFQWSLKSGGQLVLVPVDGHYYPARRTGEGVVETLPLALAVSLYFESEDLTVPLTEIRSPYEIDGRGWIMERFADGDWLPVAAMHFHDSTFYGQDMPGAFEPLGLAEIRFRPRAQ
ncbi:MAG: hypothetical protein ACFBSD_14295 [Paracoccaceae bacterium]